jgi:hypothetical protein
MDALRNGDGAAVDACQRPRGTQVGVQCQRICQSHETKHFQYTAWPILSASIAVGLPYLFLEMWEIAEENSEEVLNEDEDKP